MPTLQISTESKRPSLKQNIMDLYASFHVGGAYDDKADVITNGTYDDIITSAAGKKHAVDPGFKTLMAEQATQMKMGLDASVVTTTYRTSIYGSLDTTKYSP